MAETPEKTPDTPEEAAPETVEPSVDKAALKELARDTGDIVDRAISLGGSGIKALGGTLFRRGAKYVNDQIDEVTGKKD